VTELMVSPAVIDEQSKRKANCLSATPLPSTPGSLVALTSANPKTSLLSAVPFITCVVVEFCPAELSVPHCVESALIV